MLPSPLASLAHPRMPDEQREPFVWPWWNHGACGDNRGGDALFTNELFVESKEYLGAL